MSVWSQNENDPVRIVSQAVFHHLFFYISVRHSRFTFFFAKEQYDNILYSNSIAIIEQDNEACVRRTHLIESFCDFVVDLVVDYRGKIIVANKSVFLTN